MYHYKHGTYVFYIISYIFIIYLLNITLYFLRQLLKRRNAVKYKTYIIENKQIDQSCSFMQKGITCIFRNSTYYEKPWKTKEEKV